MRVCLVGLGSIAARHIRNLHSIYGTEIEIDVVRSGNGREADRELRGLIDHIYWENGEIPCGYDVIFITNPTTMHYASLRKMHSHGKHFFIEKPVFQTGEENIEELELREESVYYVACPLRYTNVIQYLKKEVDFSKIYSMRCISSSYLPEWRPEADYRRTYSAKKGLGGGVAADLIHEWDYIRYLIGEPKRICCFTGKKSELEIDSDDIAVYIAEYRDKMVELHLDYFGEVATRKLELYGREDVIEADLIKQQITYGKNGRIIDLPEDRDSYQKKELIHFFKIIDGELPNDNSILNGCKTLRIARGEIT